MLFRSLSQLSIIGRIDEAGTTTVAELARIEHIRQQSVSELVAALRRQGLVQGRPDPTDGRRALLSLTAAGHEMVKSIVLHRGAWLAQALDATVSDEEREILAKAAPIMNRLAASDIRSERADSTS